MQWCMCSIYLSLNALRSLTAQEQQLRTMMSSNNDNFSTPKGAVVNPGGFNAYLDAHARVHDAMLRHCALACNVFVYWFLCLFASGCGIAAGIVESTLAMPLFAMSDVLVYHAYYIFANFNASLDDNAIVKRKFKLDYWYCGVSAVLIPSCIYLLSVLQRPSFATGSQPDERVDFVAMCSVGFCFAIKLRNHCVTHANRECTEHLETQLNTPVKKEASEAQQAPWAPKAFPVARPNRGSRVSGIITFDPAVNDQSEDPPSPPVAQILCGQAKSPPGKPRKPLATTQVTQGTVQPAPPVFAPAWGGN